VVKRTARPRPSAGSGGSAWRDVAAGVGEKVEFGSARLVPDPRRRGGWTLLVEEVQQSYVDVNDPTHLAFEYARMIGTIVDVLAPSGEAMRVLHLGGGALTLPRYVAATRPGAQQVVVERDPLLVALVERTLPLATDANIRVQIGDARQSVAALADERFDLVIGDVYHAAQIDQSVCDRAFVAEVARVLRPDGVYAVNLADVGPLSLSRGHATTLRTSFAELCMLVRPELLRGHRFGNVVLAAAKQPDRLPLARLAAAAARDRRPYRVISGAGLEALVAGGASPSAAATPGRVHGNSAGPSPGN
jgi:spermidine synthase